MRKIFLATGNKEKIAEISAILIKKGVLVETCLERPDMPQVKEDGLTIRENSLKKAMSCAVYFKEPSIADDTALEVEALNGAPGVYSARWAGEGCTYEDNNKKLLHALNGLDMQSRKARFVCCITLAYPDGKYFFFEGFAHGYIAKNPAGQSGFGYDPLFYCPQYGLTYAQMPVELKNRISHRAKALAAFAAHAEKLGI